MPWLRNLPASRFVQGHEFAPLHSTPRSQLGLMHPHQVQYRSGHEDHWPGFAAKRLAAGRREPATHFHQHWRARRGIEPSFTPQAEQRYSVMESVAFFLSGARSPRPRARRQDHLTNVFGKDAQIMVTPQKDYKYRVVAERKKWPRSSPLESTRLTM
jgi:hypothetical protein